MRKIVYCKYANERADRFAIRTDIVAQDGEFFVCKKALMPSAEGHIENIEALGLALSEQYQNSKFTFNKCQRTDEGIELEFVKGETLAEVADKLIYAGKSEEAKDLIFDVIGEIYKVNEKQEFKLSKEFVEVFGKVDFQKTISDEKIDCAKVSDIDMLMNNIMQGNKWTVIDYEWSFNFPVPLKFIAYRLIHYYLQGNHMRGSILDEAAMYREALISDGELEIYKNMEVHFQNIYVLTNMDKSHHTPLRDLYAEIGKGGVDVKAICETARNMAVTPHEHENLIKMLESRAKMYGEHEQIKKKLAEQEEKIATMEGTKVWKVYRKYRDMKEKP